MSCKRCELLSDVAIQLELAVKEFGAAIYELNKGRIKDANEHIDCANRAVAVRNYLADKINKESQPT